MEHKKGKPLTTSVPSLSIKFHANGEHLEKLWYSSDEEQQIDDSSTATGISEPESSPLKYLPRLVKRSTSIDITPRPTTTSDASPPSDAWRIFSDLKGKFTKSVEEKITEIRSRNQDDSPLKTGKNTSKENSSLSDSESESSISKTCGLLSTTEGVEMSSDDETPSLEKDAKKQNSASTSSKGVRQRFRIIKPNNKNEDASIVKEGTAAKSSISRLYQINNDIEQALPDDVEDAMEACESNVLQSIDQQYDNIELDGDRVLNVREVNGKDLPKPRYWGLRAPRTVYAPIGFVDFRQVAPRRQRNKFLPFVIISVFLGAYFLVHRYSTFLAGGIVGFSFTFTYYYLSSLLSTPFATNKAIPIRAPPEIIKIPSVREYTPVSKFEGWLNELPTPYDPHTYHITQTQSVFMRLQGNLLRVSHTRSKVPKRALWNEAPIKPVFIQHRVYNLLTAKITLLPVGLAKKRHWSKKYPICIELVQEKQLDFDAHFVQEEDDKLLPTDQLPFIKTKEPRKKFGFRRKTYKTTPQRFSKLTEENEEFKVDKSTETSRASTPPSPNTPDFFMYAETETETIDDELEKKLDEDLEIDADWEVESCLDEDWTQPLIDGKKELKEQMPKTLLYIFGRTDREKEDWYRRLVAATHRGASYNKKEAADLHAYVSNALLKDSSLQDEYIKYMLIFNKVAEYIGVDYPIPNRYQASTSKKQDQTEDASYLPEDEIPPCPLAEIQWINALIGRILFDCFRDDDFQQKIHARIQRKLSSIKLPYFIEDLQLTELSLGKHPPLIHRASRPTIDERGLWIDLDVTYDGLIVLILQTKLNLMRLKDQNKDALAKPVDRPAMYHSDVDDSAESSTDDETIVQIANATALDANGVPVLGLGGHSNKSKKFMKMVDRIAESKFFQAATEYRYIKKAMEGVSKTDLRLKVEIKELVGTLVLNVPTPPSDRIWISFRPTPDLNLSAQPIVGERNITFLRITSWIEKKLLQEFHKLLVIPNMEDVTIPGMSHDLPQ